MSLKKHSAWWTFDERASEEHGLRLYYFSPSNRGRPPYREQLHVEAILDIAADGTLAGIELIHGDLPLPPTGSEEETAR
jgi:hypothetical protein